MQSSCHRQVIAVLIYASTGAKYMQAIAVSATEPIPLSSLFLSMSVEQQVALARPAKPGESSHLSKAARQVVPPFLQKLYEQVQCFASHLKQSLILFSCPGS